MQDSGGRRRRSPRTNSSSSSKSNESLGGGKQGNERVQQRDNGTQNKKGNSAKGHKNIHRTSSHDHVRKLVETEGRTARNLIAYSVPLSNNESEERNKRSKQKSLRRNHSFTAEKSGSSEREGSPREVLKSPSRSRSSSRKGSGSLSGKTVDLRARYWNYLFENLKRAVDEIYSTCEADESIVECQEVIMMLEQCRRDFSALIDRINVQVAFEKAEYNDRPTSLAWEVRKSSPGKTLIPSPVSAFQPTAQRVSTTSPVRNLSFSSPATGQSATNPAESSNKPALSWADKVKGTPPSKPTCPRSKQDSLKSRIEEKEKYQQIANCDSSDSDSEGWETVHHGKKLVDGGHKQAQSRRKQVKEKGKRPVERKRVNGDYRANIATDRKNDNKSTVTNAVVEGRSGNKSTGTINAVVEERNGNKSSVTNAVGEGRNGNKSSVTNAVVEGRNDNTSSVTNAVVEGRNDSRPTVSCSQTIAAERQHGSENDKPDTPLDFNDIEQDNASDEEHEKAICAAMEQEESLNKEYEEMQERTIQSAMEHVAILTEEIAKEEAFVTALNGECETPELEMEEGGESGEGEAGYSGKADELNSTLNTSGKSWTWDEMVANYDAEHASGQNLSWGDIVEQSEGRSPGRAVQMHQKLSSPSRKKPLAEVIRIHEEKQAKAQHQRERLLDERLNKLQMLSEKVQKVQELKEELIQEQQNHLSQKQQRAEQQRLLVLQEKIRKAKGEEAKVNEIAFINHLEAQNKKIEVMTRHQGHEARLQDIQEERQRKKEEQQAKEAAAQERRRQLEAERLARLEEMQQKKLEQEAKYKREKLEKEKAREEAAKERAREREMRIAARNEALQTATEQLQLKIQQKQTETMRRHEHQLEQVKEKAAGVSKHSTQDEVPAVTPYDQKKMCTLCNVEIISEVYLLSHLRGKKHQAALADLPGPKEDKEETVSLQYIKEMPSEKAEEKEKADQERQKSLRKRAKKLRTRMAAKGREYESNLQNVPSKRLDSAKKPRLQKLAKDLNRILQAQSSGPWAANRAATLERSVGELNRILEPKVTADQVTLCHVGGLAVLMRVLLVIDVTSEKLPAKPIIPNKALCSVTHALTLACTDCLDNSQYMIYTNKLGFIVDLFLYRYKNFCLRDTNGKKVAENEGSPHRLGDPLASALLSLLASVLQCFATASPEAKESAASVQRMVDLISYIVCSGVVDDIREYFELLQGPFHEEPSTVEFVKASMEFLSATTQYLGSRSNGVFEKKKEDLTQFVLSSKETELVGTVSLLYAMLLHVGGHPRHSAPPPILPESTIAITTEALSTLNNLATVDLRALQSSLGAEGISLEFRHIVSYVLWICSDGQNEDLLHEVILIVGYFTVLNQDNQVFVQSGRNPTLLQQLCALPFQYFSDPRLRNVLFPTLISSCFENEDNKKIVEQEVSCALLENFVEEKMLESQEEELLPSQSARHYDGELSQRFSLSNRFPPSKWIDAGNYFRGNK